MKDGLFNGYIARNYAGGRLTDQELRVLRDGDLEAMIATFVKMKNDRYRQQLSCVLKSLKYYLGDDVTFEAIAVKNEYEGQFVGCQMMDGDEDVFFGISGEDSALIKVASAFADEEFEEFDADAYDAVCELINCTNGMFATKLSAEDVEVALRPPVFYECTHISGENGFYVVTIGLRDFSFDVLLSVSDRVQMKNVH